MCLGAIIYTTGGNHPTLLKLSRTVVEQLEEFSAKGRYGSESGGVLLGRDLKAAPATVVDDVTAPLPSDTAAKYRFSRSEDHQLLIDVVWRQSGGRVGYVGEWHTHSERDPSPSRTDRKDWKRRLREDQVDANQVYFVIAGLQRIGVWVGERRTRRLRRMKVWDDSIRNSGATSSSDRTRRRLGGVR